MNVDIESQNSKLSEAGKVRSQSSGKTHSSNGLSARISSTKSSGQQPSNIEQVSNSELKKTISDPIKGSFEGLDRSSSGHILMSGDGYDNPQFQTARYKDRSSKDFKEQALLQSKSQVFNSVNSKDMVYNYTNRFDSDSIGNRMRDYIDMNDFLGKNV